MCTETKLKFDSPAGWQLSRQILKERLPFGPHDYQLEGVAAILDKRDFIGVSATGSGKSAYAYMVLHIIQGLQAQPTLFPSANFPPDAAILMIYPTKALEEDQEKKFQKLGLTAKAINSDTIASAKRSKINLWTTVETGVSLILVSPEMLSTSGFKSLIESKVFRFSRSVSSILAFLEGMGVDRGFSLSFLFRPRLVEPGVGVAGVEGVRYAEYGCKLVAGVYENGRGMVFVVINGIFEPSIVPEVDILRGRADARLFLNPIN